MRRSRIALAGLAALVVVLGLATRPLRPVLPRGVAENAGDILWALLVFLCLAFLRPRAPRFHLALATFAIALAVECSQLFHPAWLDAIRRTTLGGLVLGWGFAWGDLVCYAVGAALGVAADARGLTRSGGRIR
jgi:hypothetical protein